MNVNSGINLPYILRSQYPPWYPEYQRAVTRVLRKRDIPYVRDVPMFLLPNPSRVPHVIYNNLLASPMLILIMASYVMCQPALYLGIQRELADDIRAMAVIGCADNIRCLLNPYPFAHGLHLFKIGIDVALTTQSKPMVPSMIAFAAQQESLTQPQSSRCPDQ